MIQIAGAPGVPNTENRRCHSQFMEFNTLCLILSIAAVVLCAVFFAAGILYRKKVAEKQIGSAEEEAKRIINEAIKGGENKKREMLLEAKEEIHKSRSEYEQEVKERRAEVSKQERRLQQKEEALDKKINLHEKKEDELAKKITAIDKKQEEVDSLKRSQMEVLEKISGLTQDEADSRAREIIATAIQRCAADHASEVTVSVVPLPNDEMKGRIIGREGRNIRALETATGVDLIIDDTPEAITLSSFDQTRREVARMTLERLIGDGRIHPARIEETVEKCRHDLELQMKREGERAVMELGIHGLHPDLIKLIGRLKYRTSFGQNALTHSMEVAWLAGLLAGEMGVNVTLARRAGLLHDIGKALDHEIEGSHVQIGVDICRKYKENTQVIHAIEAHHGDVEPKTPLAFIIQACDAISAARPGARRENVESYVKRLENLEEISSSFEGVEQAFAVQAGREVRIMVKPDVISDDQVILLARSIAKKIEDTLDYPGQIKVNVIRESRAVEYAK